MWTFEDCLQGWWHRWKSKKESEPGFAWNVQYWCLGPAEGQVLNESRSKRFYLCKKVVGGWWLMHGESSNQCTRSGLWITIIVKNIVDIVIFGIFQVPTDSLASSFFLPLLWLLPSSFPRSKSWLSLQKQKMQIDYFFCIISDDDMVMKKAWKLILFSIPFHIRSPIFLNIPKIPVKITLEVWS